MEVMAKIDRETLNELRNMAYKLPTHNEHAYTKTKVKGNDLNLANSHTTIYSPFPHTKSS